MKNKQTDKNSCPLSPWWHPTISSSVIPFSSHPHLSQHQGLFQGVSSSHQMSKTLEFQLQHQSFQWTPRIDLLEDGLVGSPCSPRNSQESSPTPQFKSFSSSLFNFLYCPTLTSIHDYWQKHNAEYKDIPFKVIIHDWLYSLCCIYLCSLFILYIVVYTS